MHVTRLLITNIRLFGGRLPCLPENFSLLLANFHSLSPFPPFFRLEDGFLVNLTPVPERHNCWMQSEKVGLQGRL